MSDLNSLTLAEARDGLKKKILLGGRARRRASRRDREGARAQCLCAGDAGARQRDGESRPTRASPPAKPGRWKAFRSPSRTCSAPRACAPPPARTSSTISCRPTNSTVTANLWRDGAVLLGKINNDEFAMGSSNETSYFGPVISPWRRKGANTPLTPGGSSGGSAAAVAAQLCLGATGTDTGGSIRQPAAFTGTVGIKPTYGRCSRWGIVAFASSLDQAGPFARTVRDAAILLRSMAGHDPKDTTCADLPVPDYEAAVGKSVKGLRIGIPKEYRLDGMPAEIEKLWQQGSATGSRPPAPSWSRCRCRTPNTRCRPITSSAPAEASSNLARYDGVRYGLRVPGRDIIDMYEKTRAQGFGDEVRRRMMIGTYVLSAGYYDAYYLRAQKVRTLIKPKTSRTASRPASTPC